MSPVMTIEAREVKEGMYLDLEGDTYASIPCEDGCQDCASVISAFECEHMPVDEVEFENINTVIIHCPMVSFGCPPNHKLKVVQA